MEGINKFNYILKEGFKEPSNVSSIVKDALSKSIELSNQFRKRKNTIQSNQLSLDFSDINTKVLKDKKEMDVYRNLPLGVRVIG